MHISEGVLAAPVLIGGALGAVAGLAAGLRKMRTEDIPKVALVTAAFFVASLVHVPIGPSNSHLVLNGLMGMLLGWSAFPAVFVGLFLQAVLFQFGGLTTLGINTLNMALPAVLMGAVASAALRTRRRPLIIIASSLAGAGAIFLSALGVALSLALSGDSFLAVGKLIILAHIPVAVMEGIITSLTTLYLVRTKPEVFARREPVQAKAPGKNIIAGVLMLMVLSSGQAEAHRVNLFAWEDDGTIVTEAYYSEGRKAVNALVRIFDAKGVLLAEGHTGADGTFSYTPEKSGDYVIKLNAGMGHGAQTHISLSNDAEAGPEEPSTTTRTVEKPAPDFYGHAEKAASGPSVTREDLEMILDRKLRPVRDHIFQIEKERRRIRMKDVVGGLGYIFGIMGMAMYAASRRKSKKRKL